LTTRIACVAFPILANFPELTKLPKRQRMKLAEELWFSEVDDSLPVNHPTHKKILNERWAAYQAGSVKRITLSELERRLARS
jgi:hypothetical protein